MNQNDHEAVPMPPPAPPTYAGPVGTVGPTSRWPKVIGIISIVLGAGGTLNGCAQAVMTPLMRAVKNAMKDAMPKGAGPDPFAALEAVEQFMPWTIVVPLLLMAVAILLLVTGIALVRRRRWSIKGSAIWAVAKILAGVPAAVLAYVTFNAQMEPILNNPDMSQMPAGAMNMMSMMGSAGGIVMVVIGLLWGWAYPIFILIWFSRRKIKDEVAGWE